MSRQLSKSLVLLLVLTLVLSMSTMGGASNNHNMDYQLAEIFGEYDLSSSELVTVIVEIQETSVVEAKHNGRAQTKERVLAANEKVAKELKGKVAEAKISREYHHLFAGFAVELPQNKIPELILTSGVKAIYPNVEYQTTQVGEGMEIAWDAVPNMLDSAPHIQSQEAWDAGFTGKGVTVAVIDTGVDYTHPDLAHAFGDYKGWDFVDNDNDPQETPPGDPRGASTDHGTHVAGTVAANGGIKGVAPEATLLAYRVLGPGGSGSTLNVIAGIERAVQDGADVMNLSLGNSQNNPDFATSIALDWAMAEGVVAVTSNGNSGPNNWTVGSPGTSREAISVGATQLPYNVYTAEIFTTEGVEYPSSKVMGFPSDEAILSLNHGEYEFVDVGLAGTAADFEGKDLEGKVALIRRGNYPFVEKAANAKAAGAVGAIIYNNVAGEQPEVAGLALPTVMTTLADGQKLLAELGAGNNTVSFNIEFAKAVGETVASFSSRGPVMDTWMIKPDVSAPGVAIVSTIPNGYGSKQGTSMAAPHVAGAVALILQANPDWSVEFVKAALMNTAETLYDANGNLYPHNSQGAGGIRILDAINAEVLATPGSHSFGIFLKDDGREVRRQSFTIHNLSDKRVRYNIEFTGHEGIKVQTSNNLEVQPGRTQNLNFGVQVDSNLEPGYYEGTFLLSDGKQTIEVPTILFVQNPDFPLLSAMSLGLSGGYLVGTVNVPIGAEVFNLRIRNADTGQLLAQPARVTNIAPGIHSFSWDMTINGQALTPGRYQINAYAENEGRATELQGGVLTIN